jgi:hypothetical protein
MVLEQDLQPAIDESSCGGDRGGGDGGGGGSEEEEYVEGRRGKSLSHIQRFDSDCNLVVERKVIILSGSALR